MLELVEEYADAELSRELGQWVLQRLMEMEAERKVGAVPHERRIATDIATESLKLGWAR